MKNSIVLFANHPKRSPIDGKRASWTIYRDLKNARTFWNWVVEWDDDISRSPFQGITVTKPNRKPASEKAVPLKDLRALVKVASRKPRDRAMLLLIMDTGCRRGALCSLTVDCLDLDVREARFHEKGDEFNTAPFSKYTAEALRRWLKMRPNDADHDAVFTSFSFARYGQPISPHGVSSWLRILCGKANIPTIGTHAIRHSVGVHLSMSGEPLSLLRDLLGHSSSQVTMDYYMPDSVEQRRQMIDRNGLVTKVLEGKGVEDTEGVEDEEKEIA